jgi:hypothetical protein
LTSTLGRFFEPVHQWLEPSADRHVHFPLLCQYEAGNGHQKGTEGEEMGGYRLHIPPGGISSSDQLHMCMWCAYPSNTCACGVHTPVTHAGLAVETDSFWQVRRQVEPNRKSEGKTKHDEKGS